MKVVEKKFERVWRSRTVEKDQDGWILFKQVPDGDGAILEMRDGIPGGMAD